MNLLQKKKYENYIFNIYDNIWKLDGGRNIPQWKSLEHNGPMFPSKYKKHNIPILINGVEYNLPELAEEYATLYSKHLGSIYIENDKFNENFWNDFKITLPNNILNKITSIHDIDFSLIYNYIIDEKEKKKKSADEIKKIKKNNDEMEELYKYCKVDGYLQTVGNFKIEPPGIFIGRGVHPKIGMIKKRINPEDVIINISKNVTIPVPNIGGKWKKIVHDNKSIWLASWKDKINNKTKYIFTSFESIFKTKSDKEKFELARNLKKNVNYIRKQYINDAVSNNIKTAQHATALYLIDNLALRIGGNKDTAKKADTVGVTSLRVEHIKLSNDYIIELDFLSKDSIRYCKKINIDEIIYNNIKNFMINKKNKDKLFDNITNISLNKYLNDFMKGITSKVWRTFNASNSFQTYLNNISNHSIDKMKESEKINYLIMIVNQANTQVALLCNHQKAISSTLEIQLEKINKKIKKLYEKLKKGKSTDKDKIKNEIKILKLKKETKNKMKNVSLGTSKDNYIDPRIIFSFMKKYNIPYEKLFNKKELERFKWAMYVDDKYIF